MAASAQGLQITKSTYEHATPKSTWRLRAAQSEGNTEEKITFQKLFSKCLAEDKKTIHVKPDHIKKQPIINRNKELQKLVCLYSADMLISANRFLCSISQRLLVSQTIWPALSFCFPGILLMKFELQQMAQQHKLLLLLLE